MKMKKKKNEHLQCCRFNVIAAAYVIASKYVCISRVYLFVYFMILVAWYCFDACEREHTDRLNAYTQIKFKE